MEHKIRTELERVEHRLQTEDISKRASTTKEWRGADVIITKRLDDHFEKWLEDQPGVTSLQNTESRPKAVITEYSKELSWLFYKLRDIFSDRIDYVSKHDFYGSLAQSAIDYLKKNRESEDIKALLLSVLSTSKGLLEKSSRR
jgi:hypothetical protein